jgi:hypothetical protein
MVPAPREHVRAVLGNRMLPPLHLPIRMDDVAVFCPEFRNPPGVVPGPGGLEQVGDVKNRTRITGGAVRRDRRLGRSAGRCPHGSRRARRRHGRAAEPFDVAHNTSDNLFGHRPAPIGSDHHQMINRSGQWGASGACRHCRRHRSLGCRHAGHVHRGRLEVQEQRGFLIAFGKPPGREERDIGLSGQLQHVDRIGREALSCERLPSGRDRRPGPMAGMKEETPAGAGARQRPAGFGDQIA